ncbi:2-methylaconitate cis-trans isomerase PrpF family protein [Salirhabdus salicampi]|uniref:2-methylaconitate cis-trans isomerase PrpF family protein n=1 Tax=Salirhabdus salicampi TaxID=476102 RepID=UPI0020C383B8|nr:PrpF domain-containing protein [Salirhabdus salicampi]MCP8616318.1 PrpF protein [Salirhabdus salicampi]
MDAVLKIPCTYMRGGTSKGLVVREEDLPDSKSERDQILLRIFGSPDKRQTDGIGGGTSLTSKLCIVGNPTHNDAHINYTFGQVSIDKPEIDYKPTCGNMSTCVGLYAAEEGYVKLVDPITTVKIYNTNTKKMIEVDIPVENGKVKYDGDFSIDGVPGTASKMVVNFVNSGGAITGNLLPTGNVKDVVTINDGREFVVSVIDCANLVVFVDAEQFGLSGAEVGDEFHQNDIATTIEAIRVEVGFKLGLFPDKSKVSPTSHAIPKIALVAKPQSYTNKTGEHIKASEIDLVGRYISMGILHEAFAVSGGCALAAASQIPGSIVNQILNGVIKDSINIGHPSGIINVESTVVGEEPNYLVERAAIGRTARRIMDGYAYVHNLKHTTAKMETHT